MINETIKKMLEDGQIQEKQVTINVESSGYGDSLPQVCSKCIFHRNCKAKYHTACMAHNREDKRSVYYVENR